MNCEMCGHLRRIELMIDSSQDYFEVREEILMYKL